MYFLAIRPVSNSARRSWRLRLLVRPASKWRLLHWWRLTLPEAVIFIRFLTLLFVFCLGIVCHPRPVLGGGKKAEPRAWPAGFRESPIFGRRIVRDWPLPA